MTPATPVAGIPFDLEEVKLAAPLTRPGTVAKNRLIARLCTSVAPFEAVLINLKAGDAATDAACETLYAEMQAAGLDTLYDDRDAPAGSKFATADLVGIPYQIILGPRGLKDGQAEIKHRKTGERETLPLADAVERVRSLVVPQRRDQA